MKSLYYTERLILKVLTKKDARIMLDYYNRNKDFLREWEPERNKEFFTLGYHKYVGKVEYDLMKKGNSLRLWIFKREDEECIKTIGTICFSNIIRGILNSCFLGYKLDAKEANKGYTTEAVKKGLDIMFNEWKLHRIEANVMPKNKPSLKVVRKLGFDEEGLSKNYLKINGRWEDHIRFALLNKYF